MRATVFYHHAVSFDGETAPPDEFENGLRMLIGRARVWGFRQAMTNCWVFSGQIGTRSNGGLSDDRVLRRDYATWHFFFVSIPRSFRSAVRGAADAWWAIRHRIDPRHRYHIISTGLPPGYYDPCAQILFAVMHETERFLAKTDGVIDRSHGEDRAEAHQNLTAAITWWKANRDEIFGHDDDELMNQADEHLCNIMRARQYLWYP